MKCEWVRENITLHVYGELADDARHELEQHVARCADCAAELKAEQEFHAVLSQDWAGALLASSGVRSGELAAADALFARAGFSDSDSWVCRGSGGFLPGIRSSADELSHHRDFCPGSRRGFDHRHPFHHT